MRFPEYASHDALGLAALVRAGEISPLELVEAAIARIERANPRVNAVVTRLYDRARAAAAGPLPDGPFRGVPFLVKDLGSPLAGVPLTNGSRYFARFVPDVDAELFRRYQAAGLVIVGKTNTPELGLLPYCEPVLFGPTHTPWKEGHTSGGSSGGAAAAVAAGMVPMAHGGDGGGSLRMPASCCGIFGFKPSRGRMPTGPWKSELWWGYTVEHAMTRSVRDSAALLDASHGASPGDSYQLSAPARPFADEVGAPPGRLRIALSRRPPLPGMLHPDCAAAVEDAGNLLATLGHDVEEADLDVDPMQFARDFFLVVCLDTAAALTLGEAAVGRPATLGDVELPTWLCAMIGRQHAAVDFALARDRLLSLTRKVVAFLERYDLLLTPTLARPPVEVGALAPRGLERTVQAVVASLRLGPLLRLRGVVEATVARVFSFMPFTPLANVAGTPSMNVPLFWNDAGLPIGTMLTGRLGDEATLFRVAAQLEAARPWAARRPPLHADA
jgi:amidase